MGKKLIIGIVVFAVVLLAAIFLLPLAYFDTISADNLIPERCSVSPDYSCLEFKAVSDEGTEDGTGVVNVMFSNQMGQTITSVSVEGFRIGSQEANADCDVNEEFPLEAGENFMVVCDNIPNSELGESGEKQSMEITLEAMLEGRSMPSTSTADLNLEVN